MSVTSQDLQKVAGRRTGLIVFAIAAVALGITLGISVYMYAEPSLPVDQDTCLAAHAAGYGITTQQLMRDVSHQSELVAALSSCYGMTP